MKEIIQNLVRYNTWANTRYSKWIESLPIGDLDKEVNSSYNTLTKTLGHIIDAQQFWTLFLKDVIYTSYQWNNCKAYSPIFFTAFMESTIQFEECCNSFTESDLQEKRKFDTPWAVNELSLSNYIIHTINHNSYHRGQIVTISHQLGHTDNIPHSEYSFYMSENVLQKL